MENAPSPQNKLVPVLIGVIIIGAFLLGSMYSKVQVYEKGGSAAGTGAQVAGAANPPAAAAPAAAPEATPVDIKFTDAERMGNKSAKVAIVEFTDYQCPFCGQLAKTTFPDIKKNYIDTGKVQYVVRDFPLFQIHPQAQKAAEATRCAKEQGKFWEMHDKLFANQTALTIDDLKKYGTEVGLNAGQYNSCLDSGKYAEAVKADQAEGEKYGVRGTPASFVGVISGDTVKQAIQVSGAVPFDSFKTEIENQLKKV